jgi:hypothetical protein
MSVPATRRPIINLFPRSYVKAARRFAEGVGMGMILSAIGWYLNMFVGTNHITMVLVASLFLVLRPKFLPLTHSPSVDNNNMANAICRAEWRYKGICSVLIVVAATQLILKFWPVIVETIKGI